jgi:hypothetical protein
LENKHFQTPLDLAMKLLRNDIMDLLVVKKAQTGSAGNMKKLLFHAVRYQMISLIKYLVLNRGISFSETDEEGDNILQIALQDKNESLVIQMVHEFKMPVSFFTDFNHVKIDFCLKIEREQPAQLLDLNEHNRSYKVSDPERTGCQQNRQGKDLISTKNLLYSTLCKGIKTIL